MQNKATVLMLVVTSLAISGCMREQAEVKESLKILGKLHDEKSVPGNPASRASKPNCELKNGPVGCTDDKQTAKKPKTTYFSYGPCQVKEPYKDETMAEWRNRDPRGIKCMQRENKKTLAQLEEIEAWNEKNRRLEAERRREAARPSSSDTTSAGSDTGGTWYCDTYDGSGVYGTYRMRENSRINAATCKKVSD